MPATGLQRQPRRAAGRERITISLDRVTAAQARQEAMAHGQALSGYLASLIQRSLDESVGASTTAAPEDVT